jgi:hypothetical protein
LIFKNIYQQRTSVGRKACGPSPHHVGVQGLKHLGFSQAIGLKLLQCSADSAFAQRRYPLTLHRRG